MIRPAFVSLLVLLAITLPLEAAGSRPNIVIIYADDLGFGDVSCNGAKPGLTPNIARLAREPAREVEVHLSATI